MIVFAFDRDLTVDVNEGPVPLALVRHLAHCTDHQVWATGNQLLKDEAGIPGIAEIITRAQAAELPVPVKLGRERRIELLGDLFPEADAHIVVDDFCLSAIPGWSWFSPECFMELVAAIQLGPLAAIHGGRIPVEDL